MMHLRMARAVSRLPNGLVLRTTTRLDEVRSDTVAQLIKAALTHAYQNAWGQHNAAPVQSIPTWSCGMLATLRRWVCASRRALADTSVCEVANVSPWADKRFFRCGLCPMPQRGNGLQRRERRKIQVFARWRAFSRGTPHGVTPNLAALQCPCAVSACPDRSVLSLLLCLASVCVITHAYPKNV